MTLRTAVRKTEQKVTVKNSVSYWQGSLLSAGAHLWEMMKEEKVLGLPVHGKVAGRHQCGKNTARSEVCTNITIQDTDTTYCEILSTVLAPHVQER